MSRYRACAPHVRAGRERLLSDAAECPSRWSADMVALTGFSTPSNLVIVALCECPVAGCPVFERTFFRFWEGAISRRHAVPWTTRSQRLVAASARHAFLRGYDASLRERIRRLACLAISLPLHPCELGPPLPFLACSSSLNPSNQGLRVWLSRHWQAAVRASCRAIEAQPLFLSAKGEC